MFTHNLDNDDIKNIDRAIISWENKSLVGKFFRGEKLTPEEANAVLKDGNTLELLKRVVGPRYDAATDALTEMAKRDYQIRQILTAIIPLGTALFVFGIIIWSAETRFNEPSTQIRRAEWVEQEKQKAEEKRLEHYKRCVPASATNLKSVGNDWYTFELDTGKGPKKFLFHHGRSITTLAE